MLERAMLERSGLQLRRNVLDKDARQSLAMTLLLGVTGAARLLVDNHLRSLLLGHDLSGYLGTGNERGAHFQALIAAGIDQHDIREGHFTARITFQLLDGNSRTGRNAELLCPAFDYCIRLRLSHKLQISVRA